MGRTLLEHYSEEVVHIPGFKMQKLVTNQHNKGKIVLIILMFIIAKHTLFLTGVLLYFCRKVAGEKKCFSAISRMLLITILLYWYRVFAVK